jgi:hypothetical protein
LAIFFKKIKNIGEKRLNKRREEGICNQDLLRQTGGLSMGDLLLEMPPPQERLPTEALARTYPLGKLKDVGQTFLTFNNAV